MTAEVKNSSGATLTRVQGEWDSVLEFSYANGTQEVCILVLYTLLISVIQGKIQF